MSLTLYFLRHGETTASLTGGYCGTLDLELTPEGVQMAKDFAVVYQSLPWEAVFASPLKRTIATAKPLCEAVGIEMQLREGLKEIAYGKWEGKSPEEVNREFHDDYIRWLNDPGWNAPTGGEKGIDIARRSFAVIEEIEQKYPTGNVLVVSHKATIRIMLCLLLGIDVGRFRDRIGMLVGSVNIVEFGSRGPLLKMLGDRSHLSKHLQHRLGT
ncbi:MAG: histidine phosphatase family protein [Symploca sp. SIO3C6]|uniref:Histidine phosphatase family protein n=1 Tax=Symploca sp. SIO1C4 TaxID=2607765 RepID=A0A6B3ND40_9CYAN|nr:histidine phosphatase family protein [Symploca sp. SIO3C6]NER27551.1 histidine phosphatase family protein [Symploca sp. SIO1C4]NET06915.1 histidine phosphatase family protein [Symploca sp. SIO2B6]